MKKSKPFSIHKTPFTSVGFTLIEALVVLAIISLISVVGVISIINFQKDTVMDSAASELVSALKTAKNKSQSGELPTATDLDDYEEDYLPWYGVRSASGGYAIFVNYRLVGDTSDTSGDVVNFKITSGISLTLPNITFDRLTGKNNGAQNIVLTYKAGTPQSVTRTISLSESGVITISEP